MIMRILQGNAATHAVTQEMQLPDSQLINAFVQIVGHFLDCVLPRILRHDAVSGAPVIVRNHRVLLRQFINEAARPNTTAACISHDKHKRIARVGRRSLAEIDSAGCFALDLGHIKRRARIPMNLDMSIFAVAALSYFLSSSSLAFTADSISS